MNDSVTKAEIPLIHLYFDYVHILKQMNYYSGSES